VTRRALRDSRPEAGPSVERGGGVRTDKDGVRERTSERVGRWDAKVQGWDAQWEGEWV
jgi:hypothetical protein